MLPHVTKTIQIMFIRAYVPLLIDHWNAQNQKWTEKKYCQKTLLNIAVFCLNLKDFTFIPVLSWYFCLANRRLYWLQVSEIKNFWLFLMSEKKSK